MSLSVRLEAQMTLKEEPRLCNNPENKVGMAGENRKRQKECKTYTSKVGRNEENLLTKIREKPQISPVTQNFLISFVFFILNKNLI